MGEIKVFSIPAHEADTGAEIIGFHAEWWVEEHDADDDGGIALAIFTGPFAEERARMYAERLRDGSL